MHYAVLKSLFPLNLEGASDHEMLVEGQVLDAVYDMLESITLEISPTTAVHTLDRWEAEFGIFSDSSVSTSVRRGIVKARMREKAFLKKGTLSRDVFINIADAMEYSVTIEEAPEMFRAGISRAGDRVYSSQLLWIWTIVVHGVSEAPELEAVITDIAPPYSRVVFRYEP